MVYVKFVCLFVHKQSTRDDAIWYSLTVLLVTDVTLAVFAALNGW